MLPRSSLAAGYGSITSDAGPPVPTEVRPDVSTSSLKFGIYGLHRGSSADPEKLARRARLAEDAGFESLWVGDHIALPAGAMDPADQPRLEAVVALTYLAAVT